jgi:hypothetical protein
MASTDHVQRLNTKELMEGGNAFSRRNFEYTTLSLLNYLKARYLTTEKSWKEGDWTLSVTFKTVQGEPKKIEVVFTDKEYHYLDRVKLRSYQYCTSTECLSDVDECPISTTMPADDPEDPELITVNKQLPPKSPQIHMTLRFSKFYMAVMYALQNLPQDRPDIREVAAFDCGRPKNPAVAFKQLLLAAGVGRQIAELKQDIKDMPVKLDDGDAFHDLSHHRHYYPGVEFHRSGFQRGHAKYSDLGYTKHNFPEDPAEIERIRKDIYNRFTFPTLNENCFIICIQSGRPIRQAAMEIERDTEPGSPYGPAGMICKKIEDDGVPQTEPHAPPLDPDPSSPRLWRFKENCHEYLLGNYFGQELALYVRNTGDKPKIFKDLSRGGKNHMEMLDFFDAAEWVSD